MNQQTVIHTNFFNGNTNQLPSGWIRQFPPPPKKPPPSRIFNGNTSKFTTAKLNPDQNHPSKLSKAPKAAWKPDSIKIQKKIKKTTIPKKKHPQNNPDWNCFNCGTTNVNCPKKECGDCGRLFQPEDEQSCTPISQNPSSKQPADRPNLHSTRAFPRNDSFRTVPLRNPQAYSSNTANSSKAQHFTTPFSNIEHIPQDTRLSSNSYQTNSALRPRPKQLPNQRTYFTANRQNSIEKTRREPIESERKRKITFKFLDQDKNPDEQRKKTAPSASNRTPRRQEKPKCRPIFAKRRSSSLETDPRKQKQTQGSCRSYKVRPRLQSLSSSKRSQSQRQEEIPYVNVQRTETGMYRSAMTEPRFILGGLFTTTEEAARQSDFLLRTLIKEGFEPLETPQYNFPESVIECRYDVEEIERAGQIALERRIQQGDILFLASEYKEREIAQEVAKSERERTNKVKQLALKSNLSLGKLMDLWRKSKKALTKKKIPYTHRPTASLGKRKRDVIDLTGNGFLQKGKRSKGKTSKYYGVGRVPDGRWKGQFRHLGRMVPVGYYDYEIDAARAVDAQRKRRGFTCDFNFPGMF